MKLSERLMQLEDRLKAVEITIERLSDEVARLQQKETHIIGRDSGYGFVHILLPGSDWSGNYPLNSTSSSNCYVMSWSTAEEEVVEELERNDD